MMGEMKSFSVSPGWSVFIKASPMRKPRKPAARRLRIVSGCEMPLSETSMGILRTSEAPFFDPIACIIRKTTRTIFQNETVRFSSDCQNEMVRFELKFNSIETVFDYRFNAIKF